MIRTVVCEKEGCSGNTFFIETQGNNLVLTCEHCKSKYEFSFHLPTVLYKICTDIYTPPKKIICPVILLLSSLIKKSIALDTSSKDP